jgi:hypothetical protein
MMYVSRLTVTEVERCPLPCDHTETRHHVEVLQGAAQREAEADTTHHL